MAENTWRPLDTEKLNMIRENFFSAYPEPEYGDLAENISDYWITLLRKTWDRKEEAVKQKDLSYQPSDPLSRIEQKTMAITYADSMKDGDKPTLDALIRFIKEYFPALGGFHILPACAVAEGRFNDGYFSQIDRSRVHTPFGTNEQFAEIMKDYFSMNDFILNHVDIANPLFQEYLAGNDKAGEAFFVFTEEEFQKLKKAGSFDAVFRPRPFPLFTIFRRLPKDQARRKQSLADRLKEIKEIIEKETGVALDTTVLGILTIFDTIKNDQMLLDEDYQFITAFIEALPRISGGDTTRGASLTAEDFFTASRNQEVQHYPYILKEEIQIPKDFLLRAGLSEADARKTAEIFTRHEEELFGEKIRAWTTFSHVQVDINLTTFAGLKLLLDDLSFYLSMDLNLLRFDAVNYGFKKWGTSCFGLPEINNIMNIIYLSMECVSPRMVPNLEVNDTLTTILTQMSAKDSPPPMMHDFYLVSMLPAMFHLNKPEIAGRTRPLIEQFNIPKTSLRFSLSESHDGKSVRGSMDLLTVTERQYLAKEIIKNGGKVKFKSVLPRRLSKDELKRFCQETAIDFSEVANALFAKPGKGVEDEAILFLNPELTDGGKVLAACPALSKEGLQYATEFLLSKLIDGKEAYELCTTTRDSLPPLHNKALEIKRYLAFHTLAFALMGRNVKTTYFNDLMGLPNDYEKMEATGELRNIKRTKSEYSNIKKQLNNPETFESAASAGMNNLLALVDSDIALHCRSGEARVLPAESGEAEGGEVPVCAVYNGWENHHTLTVVNLSAETVPVRISLEGTALAEMNSLYDNIGEGSMDIDSSRIFAAELGPFERLWCTPEKIEIDPKLLNIFHFGK